MNKYQDKNKQFALCNTMRNQKAITYKELEQLQQDGIFEDFDLIRIESDHFKDMYMFYYNGRYMMITRNKDKIKQIDKELLQDRKFVLSQSETNGVQHFIQVKGREQFEKLNKKKLINIILGNKEKIEEK